MNSESDSSFSKCLPDLCGGAGEGGARDLGKQRPHPNLPDAGGGGKPEAKEALQEGKKQGMQLTKPLEPDATVPLGTELYCMISCFTCTTRREGGAQDPWYHHFYADLGNAHNGGDRSDGSSTP